MTTFSDRAYDYFLGTGYPAHAAAALAGNAQTESQGNTRAVHDGGTGLGMFGWRDPNPGVGRKTNLMNWAQGQGLDPYDEATQFQFAHHELNNDEKKWGDALKASTDLRGANDATMGYLRPQNYTDANPAGGMHYAQRYNNAAPYVGAEPMPVPINGPGAGGQGLLAPTPMADPRTANDADLGGYGSPGAQQPSGITVPADKPMFSDSGIAAGAKEISKIGQGLLAQSGPREEGFGGVPAPQAHLPKAMEMPDFTQMLAQQRLQRRM